MAERTADDFYLFDSTTEPGSFEEFCSRKYPDTESVRFINFLMQADCGNVVMLHSRAMRGGHIVNGRQQFGFFDFARPRPTGGQG